MANIYFIGMDNGGTSVKAGIYDVRGNEIATANTRVTQINPHDGWIERDIEEVWQANCLAVRKVLEKSGIDPAAIKGVAATGYGNGIFLMNKEKEPAYKNCILSGDMRAKDYIKKYMREGSVGRIVNRTKQSIWAGQAAPLLAWMKDNEPEIMKNTAHVLMCVDYLRMKLTGQIGMEISNASGLSCMDLDTRKFEKDIFEELGIEEWLPCFSENIVPSAGVAGTVTEEAAKETGLLPGTPVMGGLFDITACAIACGLTDSEKLCVVLGTWSINEYISKTPIEKEDFFMSSIYCMDEYYLELEGSTTSASNLQWFVDNFMQEEKKEMEAQGKDVYDACEAMLASVPYDDSSILFLPFLYGTNVSLDARAGFVGLTGRHTKAHMLRAVYEGILFSHMHHIDKLMENKKDKTACVRVAGGGCGSAGWMQMFADALQLPIEVPAGKELGAMGAAMCVAVGSGCYKDFREASAEFTRIKKVYQPNPERAAYYRQKYQIYKTLTAKLDEIWEQWNVLER